MTSSLTLHQGDEQREFVEHPIEIARRALLDAATLEETADHDTSAPWAGVMRRFASSLPNRGPILGKRDA